jgi:hypothetical protein
VLTLPHHPSSWHQPDGGGGPVTVPAAAAAGHSEQDLLISASGGGGVDRPQEAPRAGRGQWGSPRPVRWDGERGLVSRGTLADSDGESTAQFPSDDDDDDDDGDDGRRRRRRSAPRGGEQLVLGGLHADGLSEGMGGAGALDLAAAENDGDPPREDYWSAEGAAAAAAGRATAVAAADDDESDDDESGGDDEDDDEDDGGDAWATPGLDGGLAIDEQGELMSAREAAQNVEAWMRCADRSAALLLLARAPWDWPCAASTVAG